jgi:hypothetical protein
VGVNNQQRRAAKKKKKVGHRPRTSGSWERFIPEPTPELARATLIEALADIAADRSAAEPLVQQLLRPDGLLPPELIRQALALTARRADRRRRRPRLDPHRPGPHRDAAAR